MLTFKKNYFLFAVLLFVVEVLIALYVHDSFIRPYFGDVLVVALLYCFLKAFLNITVEYALLAVLIISFTIEFLQLTNIVEVLHLHNSNVAKTVLGTSFSVFDLLLYVVGLIMVFIIEKFRFKTAIQQL